MSERIPRHVAIIMDGNGRWARQRGRPRLDGHRRGAEAVRTVITAAREMQLECLTLYSFSAQNWKRCPREVAGLMRLLAGFCRREARTLLENGIRLEVLGRLDRLPEWTRIEVERVVCETRTMTDMTLVLAIDYGGQEEIAAAVARVGRELSASPNVSAMDAVNAALSSSRFPPPDLIIRTGGDQRLSNFMLWHAAYAELHFVEAMWPDFGAQGLTDALRDYAQRQRRFGGVVPEVVA